MLTTKTKLPFTQGQDGQVYGERNFIHWDAFAGKNQFTQSSTPSRDNTDHHHYFLWFLVNCVVLCSCSDAELFIMKPWSIISAFIIYANSFLVELKQKLTLTSRFSTFNYLNSFAIELRAKTFSAAAAHNLHQTRLPLLFIQIALNKATVASCCSRSSLATRTSAVLHCSQMNLKSLMLLKAAAFSLCR